MASQAQEPASTTPFPGQTSSSQAPIMPPLKFVPLPALLSLSQSNTVTMTAGEENSYPCRRCLLDGSINEQMLLLSYDPFLGDSPYRGAGPIFVHKKSCTPYQSDTVPEQQRRRLLSLRAYDRGHMMVGAEVLSGSELEDVAKKMLEDAKVEYLHVHNAKPGCFAVRIERG